MFLPLFPLERVVFPGERLPLHIFEPRYKQLIGEARDQGTTFGIPPYIGGRLGSYGTELRLEAVVRTYKSGEMDIIAVGLGAFRIEEFIQRLPEKLYSGGRVTRIDNVPDASPELRGRVAEAFNRLHRALGTTEPEVGPEIEDLSFAIAQKSGLNLAQKLELLSKPVENDRLVYLLEHFETVIPAVERARTVAKKISGNGHSKGFPKAP